MLEGEAKSSVFTLKDLNFKPIFDRPLQRARGDKAFFDASGTLGTERAVSFSKPIAAMSI